MSSTKEEEEEKTFHKSRTGREGRRGNICEGRDEYSELRRGWRVT